MTTSDIWLTRRELLTVSAATTVAWAMRKDAQAMGETASETGHRQKRVAVIGAGFGGLACAYELSAAGYFVDVFEARNRLGGRVRSVQEFAPGQQVEFGAELIGKNHPHWLRYAKQFGIELTSVEDDDGGPGRAFILDEKRISGVDAAKLEEEIDAGLDDITRDAVDVNWDQPWMSPDAGRLDRMSVADRLVSLKATGRAKRAIGVELVLDMAVPLERMNYLALLCTIRAHGLERFWSDTEVFRAKSGNQMLASFLAAGIRGGGLHLDSPVVRIKAGSAGMQITLRDQRELQYDDVVLAVPPSVWDKIEFSPGLPKPLQPQMGIATKFLAVCEKDFWSPTRSADSLTDTLAGSTWEGPPADESGRRSLVAFAGGPAAETLHELPLEKQATTLRSSVEEVLPGFNAAHLKSEFVDWPGDPWTRGGYSFPMPGQFLSQSRILRDGIGHLHFAGEHASFGFTGYMEGGLESGASLAQRLIQRDQHR
jgi:monoamine oxidase